MQSTRLLLALLLLAGCAAATTTPPPLEGAADSRQGDPELYRVLGVVPLDSASAVGLQRYELDHPISFLENVAVIAEDPAAGTEARYNAVMLLGDRAAARQIVAVRAALEDRDPRVRAAAVVAAGKILERSGTTGEGVVAAALEDSAPVVQAKALEVLGTRDLPLLRDFLERHPGGEAALIARGLLQQGEDRGAPLPADSAGVLRRTTSGGIRLEFRPTRRWREWDAAVGTVTVEGRTSPAVNIPEVEVVAGVVPVFFSPDEEHMVYEQGRRIHVRELRSGRVREVGEGIAPRPLPFTQEFVYLRPKRVDEVRERTRILYDVLRAGFRPLPEDPRFLGTLEAYTQMRPHGSYSPVRRAIVIERKGQFTLEADGAQTFRLPDPFKAGTVP